MNVYLNAIERVKRIRHLHLKALKPCWRPDMEAVYEPLLAQLKVLKKEETLRLARARRRVRGTPLSPKEHERRTRLWQYLSDAEQGWFAHPDNLLETLFMTGQ